MKNSFSQIEYILTLESTPQRISLIYENFIDSDILEYKPSSDQFSFKDIVGHLIHGDDDDWVPRIKLILEQSEELPTFVSFDRFGGDKLTKQHSLQNLVELFVSKRSGSIEFLRKMNISQEMLTMEAIHPALGKVNLEWLLNCWVAHDLSHLNQLNRVLVSKFSNVGPWKEYLRIIQDLDS